MKGNSSGLLRALTDGQLEAGCDEAGRGCLAGPVVAAAVILPEQIELAGLDDSKKLSKSARERLRPEIEEKATAWAVGVVSVAEIDEINILNASILAMHRALDQLQVTAEHLLIDGNRFKTYGEIPHTCIIGGDGRYRSIAAASVLAKTWRDELMRHLHTAYPMYGWDKNKGYPAPAHREAIAKFGACEHHRRSFKLLPTQLELFGL
jgi:ribonuclease HII